MTISVGAGITQSRKRRLPNPERLHSVPAVTLWGKCLQINKTVELLAAHLQRLF